MRASRAVFSPVTLGGTALAESVGDFYKGKTITMWIGFGGGGFAASAKLAGNHMARYIPGNPKIIYKNMPGQNGTRVVGFLYNQAPKDGTAIAMAGQVAPFYPIQSKRAVDFDPLKLNYIGTVNTQGDTFLFVSDKCDIRTLDDLKKKKLVVSNARGGYVDFVAALNNILGTKIIYVSNYRTHRDAFLAMQRGETQGVGGAGVMSVAQHRKWFPNLLKDKKAIPILRYTFETGIDTYPNTILAGQVADSKTKKQALRIVFARQVIDRPIVAPPGIPTERLIALQTAFAMAMNDPKLLAEGQAKKIRTDNPFTGPETKEFVEGVHALPQAAKDMVKQALDNQSFVKNRQQLKG